MPRTKNDTLRKQIAYRFINELARKAYELDTTMEQIADSINVHKSHISRMKNKSANSSVTIEMLHSAADVLGISPCYVITGVKDEVTEPPDKVLDHINKRLDSIEKTVINFVAKPRRRGKKNL